LSAFLEDYAERRYGAAAAPGMVRCLRELTASAYGSPGVLCPLYMFRITAERIAGEPAYGVDQARQFIPHLQAALEIALAESSRVGNRALWERDLIDMARQFLSDRFNLQAARLVDEYRSGDPESFRREADVLRGLLTSQERLLSSSDEFCLAPILDKAKALPQAPTDMDERIRDILTIWAGQILDYAHRDYYELVRFYYRKRVEAFLAQAAANLAAQRDIPDEQQLDPIYREIETSFVREPFVYASDDRWSGGPEQVVRELLASFPVSDVRAE
jgi:hypothetical protein